MTGSTVLDINSRPTEYWQCSCYYYVLDIWAVIKQSLTTSHKQHEQMSNVCVIMPGHCSSTTGSMRDNFLLVCSLYKFTHQRALTLNVISLLSFTVKAGEFSMGLRSQKRDQYKLISLACLGVAARRMSLRCVVLVVVGRICLTDSATLGLQTSILSLQWSSFTARRLNMINAGKSKGQWFNLVQLYCVCGYMAEGDRLSHTQQVFINHKHTRVYTNQTKRLGEEMSA